MIERKRIYLAGAYSGNALEVADNIGIGMDEDAALRKLGFAPYNPWLDFFVAMRTGGQVSVDDFQAASKSFLLVCDAMLVVDNPRNDKSKGLLSELDLAAGEKIPIFWNRQDLIEWAAESVEPENVDEAVTMNWPKAKELYNKLTAVDEILECLFDNPNNACQEDRPPDAESRLKRPLREDDWIEIAVGNIDLDKIAGIIKKHIPDLAAMGRVKALLDKWRADIQVGDWPIKTVLQMGIMADELFKALAGPEKPEKPLNNGDATPPGDTPSP
jgi:hypothetical protein